MTTSSNTNAVGTLAPPLAIPIWRRCDRRWTNSSWRCEG